MANEARNEVEIRLGGKVYTIRPIFQVLSAIESATGVSTVELGLLITQGRMGIAQCATVLYQALRDHGGPDYNTIGQLLVEEGYQQHILPLSVFLLRPFTGKKAEAAPDPGEAKGGSAPTK